MFALGILEQFSGKNISKLVTVYSTKIKSHDFEDNSHEEADSHIPHQVLDSIIENSWEEVCIWLPDKDVLTLLLDLVVSDSLAARTRLPFLAGRGTKYKENDVVKRVQLIEHDNCHGFIFTPPFFRR